MTPDEKKFVKMLVDSDAKLTEGEISGAETIELEQADSTLVENSVDR